MIMKKILGISALFLLAGFAFAENDLGAAFNQPVKVSIGVAGGIELNDTNISGSVTTLGYTYDREAYIDYASFNFGAFVDFTYALFSIKYATQLGNTKATGYLSGESDDKTTGVEFLLAGELPLPVSKELVLLLLSGFELDINLDTKGKNLLTDDQKKNLNDFLWVIGLGAEIFASKTLYIRPQAVLGVNLTSAPTNAPSSLTYTGLKFDFSVGFGLVL